MSRGGAWVCSSFAVTTQSARVSAIPVFPRCNSASSNVLGLLLPPKLFMCETNKAIPAADDAQQDVRNDFRRHSKSHKYKVV